jgi:branched-chain amino acid transport system substrate-binding protein
MYAYMKHPFLWSLPLIALLALSSCIPPDGAGGGGFDPGRKSPSQQQGAPADAAAVTPIMAQTPPVSPKGVIPSGAQPIKVALLLPLSGDSVAVGNAMMDAATMAISDSYLSVPGDQIKSQIVLVPKDTGNTPADAGRAVEEAIAQGAGFVIGPLFSQSVGIAAPITRARNINMLTFSNNRAVAGNGVYLFGFLPEEQVHRIAEYAYLHNLQRVALLAPNDSYGEKVKKTLIESYTLKGGIVTPTELYAPSPGNIDAAVARLAAAYNNAIEDRRFQAIFIADGGNQLKNIVSSLRRSNIDLKKVKLLGTGLWDDPEIARIPELEGAWFPSSPPDQYKVFENRFSSTYGYKPVRLASLAYDAVTLAATITMHSDSPTISIEQLTSPGGFISPANGLFRLTADGIPERKLAIMEVSAGGFKVIDPAMLNF